MRQTIKEKSYFSDKSLETIVTFIVGCIMFFILVKIIFF